MTINLTTMAASDVSARRPSRARAMIVLATIVLTTAGCGGKNDLPLAPVEGSVTYQGKPLNHGRVVFSPLDGTSGPQAVGEIGPDGSFQMRTVDHDGAPVGRHRVTVHCRRPPTDQERKDLVVTELLIPARYARHAETPLVFEVTKGGNNEYNIALE